MQVLSDEYVKGIQEFWKTLDELGFEATRAAAVALEDIQFQTSVIKGPTSLVEIVEKKSTADLTHRFAPISAALNQEAGSRELVEAKTQDCSPKFIAFVESEKLTDIQKALADETTRCITCGAYRAAIVTGWSLAFDFVRQWVFINRLSDFNDGLKALHPKKSPLKEYADFWESLELGERQFLEICSDARSGPILRGRVFDRLCHYLRERNDYAHPNYRDPTPAKANAFMENVLDIVTGAPFC